MVALKAVLFTVGIISSFLIQTQGADKYTDGNRPYEFGFNIEGEQHRHEKKDENGLIMGEFGFITADGVYHVTVYATDEQGRFKILSMKNIRVKPYPTYKQAAGSTRQGHSLDVQTPQQTLPHEPSPTQKPEAPVLNISIEPPGRSCSSCSLPTTSTQASVSTFVQPNQQNTPLGLKDSNLRPNPEPVNPQYPEGAKRNSLSNQQNSYDSPNIGSPSGFPINQQNNDDPQIYSQQGPGFLQKTPNQEFVPPKYDALDYTSGPQSSQPQGFGQDSNTGARTAKKYEGQQGFNQGQAQPNKPTLISAQMQIVDKNTDINQRGPGEKEGLPNGLTKDDMTQLLYTFNYTVGFHGHFEEGYRNGAKQGYYYVTGRNGVRTRVDYVADEKGFRPKITQEVLDLLSDDVPKPETEKEEKYGLKGYEFKWLYFPVESNKR